MGFNDEDPDGKARKKTNVTISVDAQLINEIKKEAETINTSLNSRLNSILTEYVMFYRHVSNAKSVILPRALHMKLVEGLDEDYFVQALTKEGAGGAFALLKHHNIPLTKENYVKYVIELISRITGQFNYCSHYKDDEGYLNIVLDHIYGDKWSSILGKVHSYLIEKYLGIPTKVTLLPDTVTIKLLNK
jgi:hypothetical protein